MELNKKIYKYISIISIVIVMCLIINMILPMFNSIAGSQNVNLNLVYDENKSEIVVSGTITGFSKYDLYFAKGIVPYEKPNKDEFSEEEYIIKQSKYVEDVISWYRDNTIVDALTGQTNTQVSNIKMDVDGPGKYNVLCVAYTSDDSYTILQKSKKINSNNLQIVLEEVNGIININVSSVSNIEEIKIKKSNQDLKVDDFASENVLDFAKNNTSVNITYAIDGPGAYYVYAKDADGAQMVQPIQIEEEEKESHINIEIGKLKSDANKIRINVTSDNSSIKDIRYVITELVINCEGDNAPEQIKNGNRLVGNEVIVTGNNKYISVYAVDTDGAWAVISKPISKLAIIDSEEEQEPSQGGEEQEPSQGGEEQKPSQGGEEQEPSQGGEEQNPSQGGEEQKPSQGGEEQNPSQGGEEQNPSQGGEEQNPSQGGEEQNPSQGGEEQNPSQGGAEQNPSQGGAEQNPSQSGEEQKPSTDVGSKPSSTQGTNKPSSSITNTDKKPVTNNTSNSNKPIKLPQAGNNNSIVIVSIIVLSMLSLGSFVKYKRMK